MYSICENGQLNGLHPILWKFLIPSYESTWSLLMNVPHMKVHHPMLSKYLIPSYESSSSYHMKTIIQSYEVTHSILWKALIPSYESHSSHLMNVTHSILWKALIPLDFRHYYGWCPKSPSGMSSLCGKPFKKCKSVWLRTTSNISSVFWPSKQLTH